jgi:phenylalanyl-tRNA synthetase beta chain
VLRHVGYGEVPSQLPVMSTKPGSRNANWELVDRGRNAALGAGLAEIMTWSFIDPETDALAATLPLCPGRKMELDNPLAQTQSVMRRSLLPGMLAAARNNLNQGERSLAIFEEGRVFSVDEKGAPREDERIAIVVSGDTEDGAPVSFFDLKGTVERVLETAAFPEVVWRRGGEPCIDPNEGAVICGTDDEIIGCAGLLAADLAGHWEIGRPLYVAELDLGAALAEPPLAQFEELPRYPAVTADVTVEHSVDLEFAELLVAVRELASDRVASIELKDRYVGPNVGADLVRTTLRLVYRHPGRSLTQEEVNDDQNRMRDELSRKLGVRFA